MEFSSIGPMQEGSVVVEVTFSIRNWDQLNDFIANSQKQVRGQQQVLSEEQFEADYSPTQADYDNVISFLAANQLSITQTWPNRLLLQAQGSVGNVEKVFNTGIGLFAHENTTFYKATSDIKIPTSVSSCGVAKIEVNSFTFEPFIRGSSSVTPNYVTTPGCSPADFQNVYGTYNAIKDGWTGTGTTIGIVDAYGDPTIASDVNTFNSAYGLPSLALTVAGTGGTSSGWAVETALDVEWAHAMAPGAAIRLQVSSDATFAKMDGAVNTLISLPTPPNVISLSWGAVETFHTNPSMYAAAAARGIKVYASTGDSGAYNGYGSPCVINPASDPNVIAVGGTELYSEIVQGTSQYCELGWSDNGDGWSSGGGFSSIFPEPSYQSNAGIWDPMAKRGIPDVSLDASPSSGVWVYLGSHGWYSGVGGTSLSAPMMAGIAAVALNGGWNLNNYALYSMYSSSGKYNVAFHDIYISGWNDYFYVQSGWDAVTGLGSINFQNFATIYPWSTSVSLIGRTSYPPNVLRGQDFWMSYMISNPNPYYGLTQIGLDAIIRLHGTTNLVFDGTNDIYVEIPGGTSTQSRRFSTSSSLTPGYYDVMWVVYMGPPGLGNVLSFSDWQMNALHVSRAVQSALALYFPLDEGSGTTANDNSGNSNTGIITGASWVSGKYGQALGFSGATSNYVSVPNLGVASGPFTIAAWVKPQATGNYLTLCGYDPGHRLLLAPGTGKLLAQFDGNFFSTGSLTYGAWNFVVYVFDGVKECWYINGALDSTHATTLPAWNSAFKIGQYDLVNYPYKGTIDDIRVYNVALSASEISQLYMISANVLYFPLDEGSGTTANDNSGNSNTGIITGASWVSGKYGQALSFSGATTNYISVPNLGISSSPFTIAMWVKPDNSGSWETLCGYDVTHRILLAGKLLTQFGGDFFSVGTIPYGTWSFVVYEFDGANEYWYINGALDSSHATTLPAWNSAFKIGQYDLVNYPYKGTIDDIRVYNVALSASEISQLYTLSAYVLYFPFDEGSGTVASDISGNGNNGVIAGASWVTGKFGQALSFSGATSNYVSVPNLGVANGPFTIAMWVKPTSTGDYVTLCGYDAGHRLLLAAPGTFGDGRLLAQFDGNFFSVGKPTYGAWNFIVYVFDGSSEYWYINGNLDSQHATTLPSWNSAFKIGQYDLMHYPYKGIVDDARIYGSALTAAEITQLYTRTLLYFPFDEGSGTVASDISGNGNNGVIAGASWVTGKFGQALSFSGATSNYVSVPNLGVANGPFTIAMWVKPTSTGDYVTLCGYDAGHRLLLAAPGTFGDGRLLAQFDGNFFSVGKPTYGAWNFIVYVFDGSSEYWYINGNLDSQHATTLPSWNSAFKIGQYDMVNYPYKGTIDEFYVYPCELTSDEIMQLYTR